LSTPFIQSNSLRNFESVLICLHFKKFYCRLQHRDAVVLITDFKTKTDYWSVMDPVGLRVSTIKKSRDFSTFNIIMIIMFQALQHGVAQLQTASADLWTFSINIPPP
jgi:hypothetical protein